MSDAKVDAWFNGIEPAPRKVLLTLRRLIRSVAPDAIEELNMRHIKFNGGRSPDDPAIVVLLKQAVSSSSR